MGTVTVFRDGHAPPDLNAIRKCYLDKHPDARWWLPGDDDAAHVVSAKLILFRLRTKLFRIVILGSF